MKRAEFLEKTKGLEAQYSKVVEELGQHFSRSEAREGVGSYLKSLLSNVPRKNSWQLAESVGHSTPYSFQHLLRRAVWDEDMVRDDHVRRVGNELGYEGGVATVDETGFLKKGTKSAGVARQYSGTAGKIENCQVGVFVSWKTPKGQTLLDRELYLPQEWIKDRPRCEEAGISQEVKFETKPALAKKMFERVFKLGIRPAWVVGDEVYGRDSKLRGWLETQGQSYVLNVAKTERVSLKGKRVEVQALLKGQVKRGWRKLSAGTGSKGPRFYDWKLLKIASPERVGHQGWVLFRRSRTDAKDISYYLVFGKAGSKLSEVVKAAGSRWSVEECFESSKQEVGLDDYEVRNYRGWYRHITLALVAHCILVISQSKLFGKAAPKKVSSLAAFKKKRGL